MAFVTTETSAVQLGGFTPPLVLVSGTYLSSAGGTGGVISPGYNNASGTLTAVSGSAAAGCTTIIGAPILLPTLSDATAPGGVVAQNNTRDRQEVTIVTTADTGGTYSMICTNFGATP